MKKKKILYFQSFRDMNVIPSSFGGIIKELNKNFNEFYLVNIDHLKISIKKKKYYKVKKSNFFKGLKLFNPRNFDELERFIKENPTLIINPAGRRFEDYKILYFIARKNIPQIMISHLGHVQPNDYYYQGKIKYRLNYFFLQTLVYFIFNVLVNLNFFKKVDIRFISNKKLYKDIHSSNILRKFSYIKKYVLVRSIHYDNDLNKQKSNKKHILLLELPPNYRDITWITGKFTNNKELNTHYNQLNSFLIRLKKLYNKKVIVSISPKYSLGEARKHFKNFKIVNKNVGKYIKDSSLVLFYDSSVILYAVLRNKLIINIKSDIFANINYSSDHYNKYLNLKQIDISKKIELNKKELTNNLKHRVKYYKKFLKKYMPYDSRISGNKKIISIIKKTYFK